MNMARLKGEKKKRREKEIYGICSIEIVSFTDDRIFPEVRFEWTMEKWRIRIRRTARGAEQYIFETRFPASGRKKKDNELLRWGPVSSPNYTAHAK